MYVHIKYDSWNISEATKLIENDLKLFYSTGA